MGGLLASLASAVAPAAAPQADTKPLKDSAAEWCVKVWEEHKSAYLVYHQLVWQSLLMYAGQLWVGWDSKRKMLVVSAPDDDWTPTPNINRFSPAIDAVTSTFQFPDIEALPQEEDNIDAHDVAAVANVLADWACQQCGLKDDFKSQEDKVGLARQLFVLAGSIFTIVEAEELDAKQVPVQESQPAWGVNCTQCDKFTKIPQPPPAPSDMLMNQQVNAGQPTECPNCGAPVDDVQSTTTQVAKVDPATGQPAMQDQTTWGVKLKIGNPLFALPVPPATNMEGGKLMWAERMTLDEITTEFDYEATPDSTFVDGGAFKYEQELSYWYQGFSSQAKTNQDGALVVKFFIEPGKVKEFPEGLSCALINGQIVGEKKWADAFIEHPLTKGDYLKLPTVFFGRSIAFDLMEVQRELCSYDSIMKLHAMTSAADPIVADEQSKVSEITGRGDKVIWWRAIGPGVKEPHRMGHGNLDPKLYERAQVLEDKMQNISGAVQVFRGEQPGSVDTASGIAQLRGQAEQMFSVPIGNWSALWRETVRKMVKILQAKMDAPAIAELMGENHDVQISKFKAADLDNVIQFAASKFGLPRTRDERRQELMALYDRQALDLTDPKVKETIYELFGDIGMESQFNLDATRARKENADIKKGGMPNFMPEIEDMAVHDKIHAEAIKSLDFDNWPLPAKEVMLQHELLTKQTMMEQQMAMQQAQQPQAPGGPPAPPNVPGKSGPGASPGKPKPNGKTPGGPISKTNPAPSAPPAPAAGLPI
jgi:hypothetical protein